MSEGYERDEGVESGGARGVATRAREVASTKSRDLLDRAVEQKDELKQRAAGMADDRRLQAADRAGSISRALQGAADSLRESGEPQLSSWVSQAAGQVERIVGYMQGKPADGMLHDFEDLARRNPALFLGGTYLAGMAVGRFLRASSPQPVADGMADGQDRSLLEPAADSYAEGSFAERDDRDHGDVAGSASRRDSADTRSWTGLGVGPSAGAGLDDGYGTGTGANPSAGGTADDYGTGVPERTPYRGTSEAGDGEPGLTDEDLREAWHEKDARRGTDSGYGASSSTHEDSLDTGELTRYTGSDDAEASPTDRPRDGIDRPRDGFDGVSDPRGI